MCEDNKNPTLERIKNKLNEFSGNYLEGGEICKLVTEINTKDLGNTMIETFKFK
jgi:hypothetical protein